MVEEPKTDIRELAKERLESGQPLVSPSELDKSKLIEELLIRQEELKIQNEELRRTKAELEESRAKYFLLYDRAPLGYITLDQHLMIREVNLEASVLLSTERKNLVGRALSAFISPECHERLYLHFRRLTLHGVVQRDDFLVKSKGNEKRYARFESNIIDDGAGKVSFTTILADVSEIRRSQRAEKQISDEAQRSNTDLEQFAYVASHDLQEPLRMVTKFAALLNRKYGNQLNDEAKSYLKYVTEGAERMRLLIDDLLQLSRIGSTENQFVEVDLNHLTKIVLDSMHMAVDENKSAVSVGSLPAVRGDGLQLAQVLQNLISNGIKFHGPEPPRIDISAREGTKEWIISVKDSGIGIDPEYADKLFKMFSRLHTKEEYPGTGLGLAISKKIVERHGGRIWFESEPGRGTTFFFTLPK